MIQNLIVEAFKGDPGGFRNVPSGEILFFAQDFETGTQVFQLDSLVVTPASPVGADVVIGATVQDPAATGLWHLQLAQYDGDPPVRQGLHLYVVRVGFVLNGLMRFGCALASARIDGLLPRIPQPE
ncbi:MAG: hypothetical protein FJW32_09845 [Acidobacteria bacterium]|nr:hypothetical protein [Acidobacteriota bacterium]